MPLLVYNILIFLYVAAVRFYSLINHKARLWVKGRKNWRQHLREMLPAGEKRIWLHAASMGEFEQGVPIIESFRQQYPQYKILISFFSPSGYELRKNYDKADYIVYLPMDSAANAKTFIDLVDPSLVVFVKYEFWYHYLTTLHRKNIPVILISGAFRKKQPFFHWYGGILRKVLPCYTMIFVQSEDSQNLLKEIGTSQNVLLSGDTRYDRVSAIAASFKRIPVIEQFKGPAHLIIGGSTWPRDEKLIKGSMATFPADWKLVIAPHEIDKQNIRNISKLFGDDVVLYSKFEQTPGAANKRVLVIDNIGMLSSLFYYGDIAYIGGGFLKSGIHNILEPAVFGLPILFGPIYKKFVEANIFIAHQFAFPVHNSTEANVVFQRLIAGHDYRIALQQSIRQLMKKQTGITGMISRYISENIPL